MDHTQNSPSTMASNFIDNQRKNNANVVDRSKERGMINNFNDTKTTTPKKPVNDHNFSFRLYF